MQLSKKVLFLVVTILTTTMIYAQDWPQYLGPDRNSTSEQKNILRTWPETGPEVLWIVDVGIGYGGPVVKDGKVYLLDRDDDVGDKLRCLDLSTGEELWTFEYEAPGAVMFPGSRSVPIAEGDKVYTHVNRAVGSSYTLTTVKKITPKGHVRIANGDLYKGGSYSSGSWNFYKLVQYTPELEQDIADTKKYNTLKMRLRETNWHEVSIEKVNKIYEILSDE